MNELYSLYSLVYQGKIIFLNYEEMTKLMNSEQPEDVIKLYTLEDSPFNFITNNLFRASRNPS